MYISILLATYKRPKLLKEELESFCAMNTSNIIFEIFIADNADDSETREVIESFRDRLSIRYFVESRPGKSIALNRIIPEAKGDVFVFTDDDIVADKNWLIEIKRGVERWPDHLIFGGRILPYNPEIIPEDFKKLDSYSHIYAVADWGIGEQEYKEVFGGSMIVCSEIFRQGHRFNEALGPSAGNYMSGDETEFVLRMRDLGYKAVYLPKSVVYHQIRSEQTTLKWVLGRGFRQGMAWAREDKDDKVMRIFGVPRHLYRAYIESVFKLIVACCIRNEILFKDCRYKIRRVHGMIYQYWRMSKNRYGKY